MNITAKIGIIGVNPYILLPQKMLKELFASAGRDKGAIPIRVGINKENFIQNLVKYSGEWRLYLNMPMRKAAGKDVGDLITISVHYDAAERRTPMHPKLKEALAKNKAANKVFLSLPQSLQKEIMRYINNLKTDASIEKNVKKAVEFLKGGSRFVGRELSL